VDGRSSESTWSCRYLSIQGATDVYQDFTRNGGILSKGFPEYWWKKQISPNQYDSPGRAEKGWCPDTVDDDLTEAELNRARRHILDETRTHHFRDNHCYSPRECDLGNIKVPLLSVVNWGGNTLHLRGNIQGFIHAGSEFKYLRTIVGRHGLPFYSDEHINLQLGWFDDWLKGDDRVGYTKKGKVPAVNVILGKGNVGFNDTNAEKAYESRDENEWPIARTQYTKFYLGVKNILQKYIDVRHGKMSYQAPSDIENQRLVQFTSDPFDEELDITGHSVAHLNVSVSQVIDRWTPTDIDVFLTLRYIEPDGREVHYTGTVGTRYPLPRVGFVFSCDKSTRKT
jgi:predicted acyl esterase